MEQERNNIVLIGMPSAGKSTLGIVLAKILNYQFVDADLVIQNQCDKTLQKLIDACGPEGFIQVENEILRDIEAENSIIATGSIIKGTVENSIIFRGCTVEEGAVVRNSVVMPKSAVARDVEIENVICDKYVTIGDGARLFGSAAKPLIVTRKQYS